MSRQKEDGSIQDRIERDFGDLNTQGYQSNFIFDNNKTNKSQVQCFEDTLQKINLETLTPSQLQSLLKTALQKTYFSGKEISCLVQCAKFLRKVIISIGQASDESILTEILDLKHGFYNSFYSIDQFFQAILKQSKQSGQQLLDIYKQIYRVLEKGIELKNLLIRWIDKLICDHCIRPNPTNKHSTAIILSRMSDSPLKAHIISNSAETIFSLSDQQYAKMQKQQLQGYCRFVLQMCGASEQMINRYIFPLIEKNLREDNSIQKKVLGFRMLVELTQMCKGKEWGQEVVLKWIKTMGIIEKYVKEGTQSQILRKLPPIVRFVYESQNIGSREVVEFIQNALKGGPQLFEIGAALAHSLRLTHIQDVLESIKKAQFIEQPHFQQLIAHLATNPRLQSPILKNIEEEEKQSNPIANRIIINIFLFLVRELDLHLNSFLPTVNQLIGSHFQVLRQHLTEQLLMQLRAGKTYAPWLLEQAFKAEKEQHLQPHKVTLIEKLIGKGLYEYLLAMLARNRFNRGVAEKIITVIGLLCTQRPLQIVQVEFLWKALGLHSRDEKEREQFFYFVKQVLKVQGAFTEESVHYIFFEVLLKLHANWFSLRIYQCFEALFLRLNEDFHLLSYDRETYTVEDSDLIGLQKFWYLYFNGGDIKVVKKCRDFLTRLIRFQNGQKQMLLRKHVGVLLQQLEHSLTIIPTTLISTIVTRAFQLIEKIVQHPKQDTFDESKITIIILNCLPNAVHPVRKELEISLKATLKRLRQAVSSLLQLNGNPIEMLTKGKTLQGEQMTLQQLKIDNRQTIMVQREDQNQIEKEEIKKQMKNTLADIWGDTLSSPFIDFILAKFQGNSIDTIINYLWEEGNLLDLKTQFQIYQSNTKFPIIQEIGTNNTGEISFAKQLMSQQKNIDLLLRSSSKVENSKPIWDIIRRLPPNQQMLQTLIDRIGKQDWQRLFQVYEQHCLYNLYLVNLYIKMQNKQRFVMQECRFRFFLVNWLNTLITNKCQHYLLLEQILIILVTELKCSPINNLDQFLLNKPLTQDIMQMQPTFDSFITDAFCINICQFLLQYPVPLCVAINFVKLLLYNLYYPNSKQFHKQIDVFHIFNLFNILQLPVQSLIKLLFSYNRCIHYYILQSARKSDVSLVSKVTKELNLTLNRKQNLPNNEQYTAYYECIANLITLCPHLQFQLPLMYTLMQKLQVHLNDMSEQEVIGNLLILAALLHKRFTQSTFSAVFTAFANWLFNGYLFQLNAPLPYFRNRLIRKASYDILQQLCKDQTTHRQLMSSVKGLPATPNLNEQKDVDFRNHQFIGLKNLGATCYINSLLQQLYHTKLSSRIMEMDHLPEQDHSTIRMYELKHVFMSMFKSIKNFINPDKFIQKMSLNGEAINPRLQQDATEFLMSLFEHIECEGGKQIIEEIFGGSLWNEITGLEEGNNFIKTNTEKFTTLSVDIKGRRNLQQALTYFTKGEVLQHDNMYYSEELGRKTKAMKKTYLDKLPALLVITLKRFEFDHENMSRHKLNDYFEFSTELDVREYCCCARRDSPTADPNDFKFRLRGILVHSGSAQSGHYYSYIAVGDKWYEFNDRNVFDFNLAASLKNECFGGNDDRTRSAYILFYEKTNAEAHGVHLHTLLPQNRLFSAVKADNLTFLRSRLLFEPHFLDFAYSLAKLCPEFLPYVHKFNPFPTFTQQTSLDQRTQTNMDIQSINPNQALKQSDSNNIIEKMLNDEESLQNIV